MIEAREGQLKTTGRGLSAGRLLAAGVASGDSMGTDSRAEASFDVTDFKRLRVWQSAHALSLSVHRTTTRIRSAQFASLRSQAFRAAMSIPANIAEGRRQSSDPQFARYLTYALNSTSELEYHLIVARDTKAISESDFIDLIAQTISVRKMLYTLLKRVSPDTRGSRPQPTAGPPRAPGR